MSGWGKFPLSNRNGKPNEFLQFFSNPSTWKTGPNVDATHHLNKSEYLPSPKSVQSSLSLSTKAMIATKNSTAFISLIPLALPRPIPLRTQLAKMSITTSKRRRSLTSSPITCTVDGEDSVVSQEVPSHNLFNPDGDTVQWDSLIVPDNCLRLSMTLQSGQAFRWRRTSQRVTHAASPTGHAEQWVGAIGSFVYVLRQAVPPPESPNVTDPVWYTCVNAASSEDRTTATKVVRDYFQADRDFSDMYRQFCEADQVFETIFPYYRGLRTLRQPPTECFFGFICSSNNHIKRISSMVSDLANTYGRPLATFEVDHGDHGGNEAEGSDKDSPKKGDSSAPRRQTGKRKAKKEKNDEQAPGVKEIIVISEFPTAEVIGKEADEKDLRVKSYGYRAKFIVSSAQLLAMEAGRAETSVEEMLLSLRGKDRETIAKNLTKYPGIGRKVAGCIALMSLDSSGEIPVDTHVWKIARRYRPQLAATKSLTSKVYEDVGDWFRERFGEDAGIAHNFLFIGELSEYKKKIPKDINPWAKKGEDQGKKKAGKE